VRPGDSSVRLVSDKPSDSDVQVVPPVADSDVRPRPSKTKGPSDSDIRLDANEGKKKGGDVGHVTEELIDLDAEAARLEKKPAASGPRPRVSKASNPPVLPTTSPFELSESDLNLDDPPAAKSGPRPASKAKADTDSSSDFELVAFDSAKAPGDLGSGEIPLLADDDTVGLGDLGGAGAGNSGINLQDPADSGISLEDGSGDEIEFELSLDSGTTPKPAKPAKAPKSPRPAKQQPAMDDDSSSEFELSLDDSPSDPSSSEFELSLDDSGDTSSSEFELSLDDSPSDPSDSEFELSLDSSDALGLQSDEGSDSEFELTLDDEGGLASIDDEPGKDIFEPTNFDVPALDDESGSEAVAIDEGTEESDFEISLDEEEGSGSESQVVALDDEAEADDAAATVARPRKSASKSKVGKKVVVEEDDVAALDLDLDLDESGTKKRVHTDDDDDEDDEPVAAGAVAPPAEWGPLPTLMLLPTIIVLFVVGLMGYELVQGMFGYTRQTRVSKTVIDPIARMFDFDNKLPKE